MEITYKISPTFVKFHADRTAEYKFIMGPVGSGKSTGCIFDLFFNAMIQRPDEKGIRHSRYAVIRATYPQLKSSVIKTVIEWFKDKISLVYTTPIIGRLRYDLDDGTSLDMEIMFIAIGDEQDAEKLRSWEFTGAWINEAHEIPEYLLTILAERVGRFPALRGDNEAKSPQILLDYNAVSTDHWLYFWAEERKLSNCSFFRQPPAVIKKADGTYEVNPEAENLENLPDAYYRKIWTVAAPEVINTDLMNNYGERKSGKAVYKDYVDTEHVAVTDINPPHDVQVIVGIDQGLTPAAAFMYQTFDGTLVVFDEIVTKDCSLREFAEDYIWPMINSKYRWIKEKFTCVIDPAAAQRSMNDAKAGVDILKEAGLPIRYAKSNSAVERREAVIHFLLKKKKFLLCPRCTFLRKGFISGYRYEERRSITGPQFKDKPEKNEFSHVHDALQYGVMEFISRRRKQFKFSPKNNTNCYTAASQIGGY